MSMALVPPCSAIAPRARNEYVASTAGKSAYGGFRDRHFTTVYVRFVSGSAFHGRCERFGCLHPVGN